MRVSYDLFFVSDGMESITKFRFKNKEAALFKAKSLNNDLKARGYSFRKYVVYKITKEEVG